MSASNDIKMNSEAPINSSPLHDDSENDKKLTSSLDQENGVTSPSTELDESNVTSITKNYKVWVLDDIESLIVEFVEGIAMGSAGQSMENVVNRRLFGCVAAWGAAIIQETLISAIAPTGDPCVDSSDSATLSNSRAFLGRADIALESLDPPRSCPIDDTYQRRQIPIRVAKRDHYDSEGLHHAVKAATRSHTHPASVTSSRMTMKSKVRRKQNGAPSVVEVTGPQPGVPFSTEVRDGKNSSRNHSVSPRKAIAQHRAVEDIDQANHIDNTPPSPTGAGLQLNIDLESACPNNVVATSRTRHSPPPLSKSPSSVTSSRRRPHPPGSARSSRAVKTFCFGEREEEVKVEFAVQKSSPLRSTVSIRGVLPDIDGGRMKPRPSLSYQAFGAFGSFKDGIGDPEQETESLFDEDPLDQHFQAMPLSPGVKVRTGEEANAGPDLPLFASRMRRSTFVRMETCTLPTPNSDLRPTNPNQQPGKGTFLTEMTWDYGLSTVPKSFTEDQKAGLGRNHHLDRGGWSGSKSDDLSSAETTASCSCGSSTSLTLFRKPSKVQRPCRACGNPSSESTRTDAMNFTSVVKQRAFHMKPPCLPTSSSPSKRAPGVFSRRVTSAPPACSPLARRSLMLSKKTPLPHNRDLDSPTKIL